MRFLLMFGLLIACALPGQAQGQWLGWPPKPGESRAPSPALPAAAVRLRLAGQGDTREVWVDNDLSGPVEIRIDSRNQRTGFPLQRTLGSRGSHLITRLPAAAPLSLRLEAVPGEPMASAHAVTYRLPLLLAQVRVGQAPQGRFSHGDAENRHAIDFTAPIGTPVIAARAGTVMQSEDRYGDAPGQRDQANFVRVLHADGSMAVYAHLQRGSLEVTAGQRVGAGEVLARSGNSGYSSGPHLHFAVQVNRGMRLESIPVSIETASGELRLPRNTTQP